MSAAGLAGAARMTRGAYAASSGPRRPNVIVIYTDDQGSIDAKMSHGCDWLPTLVELCGVTPPDAALDGKSLVPVIQSASAVTPHEVLHWQIGSELKAPWAVWQGDWKLLGYPVDPTSTAPLADTDPLFLTNLNQDIGETHNLATEFPDRVQNLRELHEKWLEEVTPRNRKETLTFPVTPSCTKNLLENRKKDLL